MSLLVCDPALIATVSYLPSKVAGIRGWWMADSFGLADGATVGILADEATRWHDQTPNQNSMSISTAANRPIFKTNIANGKPVVRYQDSTDLLLIFTPFTINGDWTVAMVLGNMAAERSPMASAGSEKLTVSNGGINRLAYHNGSTETESTTGSVSAANFRLLSWRRTGTTMAFRENKTSLGTGGNGANFAMDRFGPSAAGDFAEMCIWTQYVSDTDLDNLYDKYFKPKWGLA